MYDRTRETLAMIGQGAGRLSPELDAEFRKIFAAGPDDNLIKSISANPMFAGRLPSSQAWSPLSQDTLALLTEKGLGALAADLSKSITTGTGLVAYDLQAPAKNLYPYFAPIRNVLPRVGGGVGTATNWRQVNGIFGSGFDNTPWVPEGQRAGRMSYNTSNRSASYVTMGEEDAITYEAINAARTFEDLQATMVFRLLQKMMMKEEAALLGGNATMALGTPTAPTLGTAVVTNQALPSATYYVQVAPLTIEGWNNAQRVSSSSIASSGPLSAPTLMNITGADGRSFTVNGGTGPISALSAGQASGGNSLTMTTPLVPGAVAYAWYIGTTNSAGTGRLQAITTINSYVQSAALNTTGQLASALTADFSTNPNYGFDWLYTTAVKSGSGAYYNQLATGTAGTGTVLTASGRGSVVEIDTMFQSMWDQYKLSPTVLYVNSQELTDITNKVFTGSSNASLLRMNEGTGEQKFDWTASGMVRWYYNPYAPPDTGQVIPIRIHDKLPPGTILGWAENLPVQYQSNEVPNVAEVKVRQDYYQIEWPIVTRERGVGVYAEEVLAVYASFAMGVISNIAKG